MKLNTTKRVNVILKKKEKMCKKILNCLICNKDISKLKDKRRQLTCSKQCSMIYRKVLTYILNNLKTNGDNQTKQQEVKNV
jgi:hypothetical protein